MKKASLIDENMSPLSDIWETFFDENCEGDISTEQRIQMKGIFMSGANSAMRLLHVVANSPMPKELQEIVVECIKYEANEESLGRGVNMTVKGFTEPTASGVH